MARQKSKQTLAKELRQQIKTDPVEIARQIIDSYKQRRRAILNGIAANEPGTAIFLKHQVELAKLDKQERDELSERGLTPKDVGVAAQPHFVFTAKVAVDGGIRITQGMSDAEAKLDAAIRQKFDEEYGTLGNSTSPADDPDMKSTEHNDN